MEQHIVQGISYIGRMHGWHDSSRWILCCNERCVLYCSVLASWLDLI